MSLIPNYLSPDDAFDKSNCVQVTDIPDALNILPERCSPMVMKLSTDIIVSCLFIIFLKTGYSEN